jgi:predicted DCC family thiol-disulfide oxidoreductase YuxK
MRSLFKSLSNPFVLDLRALALMRIGVGALILIDLLLRASSFTAFMGDRGVMSREMSMSVNSGWHWSLYWVNAEPIWAIALMTIAAGFALMLMLGMRTRIASVASFILLASLHTRNPYLQQGGDNLLLLLAFWGCFLPWGELASIDASMVRQPRVSNRYFSAASVALVLQVMSVYFFSALLKTGVEWVRDGTGIYYALHNDQVAFGLASLWRDWHGFTGVLTHYVWWLELIGPILALSPLWFAGFRTLVVVALIAMEVGFMFNLRIGLFPFISSLSLIAILPSSVMDFLWCSEKKDKPLIQMYFDKQCIFCEKTCYLLRYLLGLNATISAAQDDRQIGPILERENSWVVVDEHGVQRLRWEALVFVVQASDRFLWVAKLMAKAGAGGDRVYNWIGDHRYGFGNLTARWMPWRKTYPRIGMLSSVFVAVLAALLFWQNLSSIKIWNPVHGVDTGVTKGYRIPAPRFFDPLYRGLRLEQYWSMFAPYPQKNDGWFIQPGVLINGELVNISADEVELPSAERPESSEQFKSYRWRKYMNFLWLKRNAKHRKPYGAWVCRDWNSRHNKSEQLLAFNMYFIKDRTVPPGAKVNPTTHRLLRYHCRSAGLLAKKPLENAVKLQGGEKLIKTLNVD